mmetsp:Transcript_60406/g.99941  ORF Transcript_60406/g.99941 Transcript_60406/m.99941 type:complete len:82 (+) Transcript_60406:2-247(+)
MPLLSPESYLYAMRNIRYNCPCILYSILRCGGIPISRLSNLVVGLQFCGWMHITKQTDSLGLKLQIFFVNTVHPFVPFFEF